MTGDAEVCIALTFDFDALSTWIGTFHATSPSMLSRGEFGPIGAERVLRLLDEFEIRATFFTPGHTAVVYPSVVKKLHAAGHEIAHHGWVHENPTGLTEDEERAVLRRGTAELRQVTGEDPKGYRSPAWDNSPNTVSLLLAEGFEYESSLMGNDFEPYWCRLHDVPSSTEPYHFGTPVPLVEIPVSWYMDDWVHFEYVNSAYGLLQGQKPPSAVLEIWKAELNYLCEQPGGGLLTITMHPQVIGRGHRLLMLQDFLRYAQEQGKVRFVRCIDYARDWRENRVPSLPRHVAQP
jgi:peptidoglycan/xylan/chitin deacetylase (PgdA/CDA1 family)